MSVDFIHLGLFILILGGEQYNWWRFSLCNFSFLLILSPMRSNTFLRLAQSVFFLHYEGPSSTLAEKKTSKILAFYTFCCIYSREGATFQNFPGFSDLLSEASKFQHDIKLGSKCSTSLASSSIPSPMC